MTHLAGKDRINEFYDLCNSVLHSYEDCNQRAKKIKVRTMYKVRRS